MKSKNDDGKLGLFEGYSLGLGSIIGAGIFSMTGIAIGMTGSSAFLAYLIAAAVLSFSLLPHLVMCSTLPTTSASYTYAGLINPKIGALYTVCWFLRQTSLAFLSLTFGVYANSLLPWINPRICGMVILTLLFVLNLMGTKSAALAQTIMNTVMIVALVSFVVFGLPKVNAANFAAPSFLSNGWDGMLGAVSLLLFTLGGGLTLPEIGSQVRNPHTTIVKAFGLVTLSGALIFAVVAFVAGGVLPLSQSANQMLTVTANAIYPNAGMVVFFVAGGALTAAATTVNGNIVGAIGAVSRSSEDGWFPAILNKKNRHNVPVAWVAALYAISMVPLLLNLPQETLSRLSTGITLLALEVPNFALLFVKKRIPNQWEKSPFHMSDGTRIALTVVSNAVMLFFVYLNLKALPAYILISIVVILGLAMIYLFLREPVYRHIQEEKNKIS